MDDPSEDSFCGFFHPTGSKVNNRLTSGRLKIAALAGRAGLASLGALTPEEQREEEEQASSFDFLTRFPGATVASWEETV